MESASFLLLWRTILECFQEASFGTAFELLFHKAQYQEEISSLGLNSESVLLFFNTEGVTDRKNFLKIVWEGAFAEKV